MDFLSICVIVWGITKMYIAHEKDFWGNDKDDDTEEQLENIWEAISNIRGEICQIKDEQQKQKTKLWKEKFLKYMIC